MLNRSSFVGNEHSFTRQWEAPEGCVMTRSKVAKSTPRVASSVVDRESALGRAPVGGARVEFGPWRDTSIYLTLAEKLAAANATSCC